eukprot:TRINITY_DN63721_c0_g1_i1.p1 TRINITY_DN63721_c0_g1~~TRINITY_DN63721_c0_g1_i1.p1  ORF type:complete len:202 (-),score=29.95 TRINITY_DN63721_c0_g1_i1:51-614(-)
MSVRCAPPSMLPVQDPPPLSESCDWRESDICRMPEHDSKSPTVFRAWTRERGRQAVPGLTSLLCSIGLSSYSTAAEAWCSEMGAAFLWELAEDEAVMEDFGAALRRAGGLDDAEQRRLRAALQDTARSGGGPARGRCRSRHVSPMTVCKRTRSVVGPLESGTITDSDNQDEAQESQEACWPGRSQTW